jgi:YggT family protein
LPFVVIGGWDLSPIVVMLAIRVLQIVLVDSLYVFASRLAAVTLGVVVG